MPNDMRDLLSRLSHLRKEAREYFGGVTWTPVTKQFGLYTANIPEQEAFISYAEHHFVELEKLFTAYDEAQASRPTDEVTK